MKISLNCLQTKALICNSSLSIEGMSVKRLSTDADDIPLCKKLCTPVAVDEEQNGVNGNSSSCGASVTAEHASSDSDDISLCKKLVSLEEEHLTANGNSSTSELLEPVVNSTYAALVYLRDLFPMRKFENRLPPIILRHQLYSVVHSRSLVELQLEELLSSGEIKMFGNGPSGAVFIVFTNDFRSYVQQQLATEYSIKPALIDRLLAVDILSSRDLALSRQQLVNTAKLTDDDIKRLVNSGLLLSNDVSDSWYLAVPSLHIFTKAFNLGRKALLTVVSTCKYHEVMQEDLMQRKLPRVARLGVIYHVHDIIGADLVEREKTSIGILLRLRTPGSQSQSTDAATLTTVQHSPPSPPDVGSEEFVAS